MNEQLIQALAVTAELCGTDLSKAAAQAFIANLSEYPEGQILAALVRCQRELKGRLVLAEVLSRIDDGRPGPEEAWAMLPWNEEQTAVITSEMQKAQGIAFHLYSADKVAARMAFKEAYISLVQDARNTRAPLSWEVSLGWDKEGRKSAIEDALAKGRIPSGAAAHFLPAPTLQQIEGARRTAQIQARKAVFAIPEMPKENEIARSS